MRIVEQTENRMILAGIPGGRMWMIILTIAGIGFTIVAVWAGIHEFQQGNYGDLLWIAIGLVIAQVMFWGGAVTLAVGREKLVLDKSTGKGQYLVKSPFIVASGKPFSFDLANIDSVSLERHIDRGIRQGTHDRGVDTEVYTARVRIAKPRRAVILLQENNEAGRKLTKALAEQVSTFLAVDYADATGDTIFDERRGTPEQLSTPLAAQPITGDIDIPMQPDTNEWHLGIDPGTQRVTITRIKRGGPIVFGCFLFILTFIGAIAMIMAVGVWLPGQTFNNQPVTLPAQLAMSVPGAIAAIVIPLSWISLFRGYRRITIDPDEVATTWIYPGRSIVRLIPGIANIFARPQSVPTLAVTSVKTMSGGDQGRVVEVRADSGRIRIGTALTEEDEERDSIVWLASAIRAAVRAFAG